MNTEFNHYGVTVSDMDSALEFYWDGLGLEVVNQLSLNATALRTFVGLEDAAADIVFLDAEACFFELLEYTAPDGEDANAGVTNNDVGASHFYLAVEDIDNAYDELVSEYKFISPL